MEPHFTFTAPLWLWDESKAAWYFITVPPKLSAQIKQFNHGPKRGFGSIRVEATIGNTTWKTSIFPEKKGTYLLPVKAAVRQAENLTKGKAAQVSLTLKI